MFSLKEMDEVDPHGLSVCSILMEKHQLSATTVSISIHDLFFITCISIFHSNAISYLIAALSMFSVTYSIFDWNHRGVFEEEGVEPADVL